MSGRRIIVSGGASGIGRATTETLSDAGASVWVLDVDEAAAAAMTARPADAPGRVEFRRADVSVERDVEAAVGEAVDGMGGLDVLISAAGIMRGQLADIRDHDEALWDEVLDVNLKGAFLASKHAARAMLEAGQGVIILVGSKAGVAVGSGSYAYGASKGGVHGLALTLDRLLGPRGIRVNDVCPGDVDTPLYRRSLAEGVERGGDAIAAEQVLERLISPQAVADVIAFLASDAAAAVRGTVFTA